MSELTQLLEELSLLGVRIAVENGQIRLDAPQGVLTPAIQSRVRESKAALIAEVAGIPARADSDNGVIAADREHDFTPFPLADLQLGFYLADDPYMELHVRPHAYTEMDYDGLDVAAYTRAWNKALRRHRRELCIVNESVELQLIEQPQDLSFREYDLRALPANEVGECLAQTRAEMARRELPLDRWPWFDLRISRWMQGGVEKSRVHYNHNNFFIDGFATSRLLDEIEAYYRDPSLSRPALEISYRDAVLAMDRLAASHQGGIAREYWFSRLADLPPPPAIALSGNLNRRRRAVLDRRAGSLDRPLWDTFKAIAASRGLTASNAIVAVYAYVLAAWSNSDHFILSQMVTRRFAQMHPQLTEILGNFASLYPLEIQLEAGSTFAENARSIQHRVLQDLKHLQLGGMRVLERLNRLQGAFGSAPSPFVIGSGLALRNYRKSAFQVLETSQTILDHQFFEPQDGSLHFVWDLIEDCFPQGLIDDMWGGFEALLQRLAQDPASWDQYHFDWARHAPRDLPAIAELPAPANECLHRSLHERGGNGASPVLIDHLGAMSHAQLDEWSAVLARRLLDAGIGGNSIVAIVMDRGRELLVATVAVLRAGAAYVPIDPALPAERAHFMLCDCRSKIALTQRRYRAAVTWPGGVEPVVVDLPLHRRRGEDRQRERPVHGSDLAYVIYTSGTTGQPKGVMIEHGAALNTVRDINSRFSVTATDRLFGVSAFGFDLSVYDIFGALEAGACVVYPDPDAALDPGHWLELLRRERITIWNSVPALMSLLVEAAQQHALQLPDLRLVMLSGDKIPLGLPDAVRAIAPRAAVVSLGGATEASIWSILYPIGAVDPAWATIPYGYAMSGQFWEVRDRHGRPSPRWVRGELYIGGAGLARGYLNDAEQTDARFIIDPARGERWYRTGDLGRYLADGCIEWMGRADFQLKIQGHRIEPAEIEAALAGHPSVAAAVVNVGNTHGDRQVLVAHVSPAANMEPSTAELESFLRNKLPAHMVPVAWRILPRLPVTPNGKIDRKALMAAAVETAPEASAFREYGPPENEIERQLCSLWERLLKVPAVGVLDDFFALGGQSFDAVRMFAAIKKDFGRAFTLSDIWAARTIRELAKKLSTGETAQRDCSVVRINAVRTGSPLFLVHPAGGSVTGYSALGQNLQRPLYGLQVTADPRLAGVRRDIAKLAEAHLANVRAVQPHGPYCLGGWSSGASIAFEMAVQLEAAGESVARVFLLDGPTPIRARAIGEDQLLAWFIQDLGLDLPVERLMRATASEAGTQARLQKALSLMQVDEAAELLPAYTIFADLIFAGSQYSPGLLQAGVTVVRVAEDVVEEFAGHPQALSPDWGWAAHTAGAVQCRRVPGTHYSFLSEGLVGKWAGLLLQN